MLDSRRGSRVLKRFVVAFFAFIGIIVPGAFALALLAATAQPAPVERPGCERTLAAALASAAASQARVKRLGAAHGTEVCTATRLYFLEVVKARAATALCKVGAERDRDLGRLDADVETINHAIAGSCS